MGQTSSLGVKRFSDSQEFPLTLWNPKVHYRIPKTSPRVCILGQINPVYASQSVQLCNFYLLSFFFLIQTTMKIQSHTNMRYVEVSNKTFGKF